MPTSPRAPFSPGTTMAVTALLVVLVLVSFPTGNAAAQEPGSAPPAAVQEPHDPRIFPGDLVRLRVWREGDMDGDYLVDQFGMVTLPKVGELHVVGETQRSLKAKLHEVYAREIRDLTMTVLVLKRIRVAGEVKAPGVFPMEPTQRVADALVMAGGRGEHGRWNEFLLRRGGQTLRVNVLEDTQLYQLLLETGDEILVMEQGWFSRNSAALLGSLAGFAGIVIAVLLR